MNSSGALALLPEDSLRDLVDLLGRLVEAAGARDLPRPRTGSRNVFLPIGTFWSGGSA